MSKPSRKGQQWLRRTVPSPRIVKGAQSSSGETSVSVLLHDPGSQTGSPPMCARCIADGGLCYNEHRPESWPERGAR